MKIEDVEEILEAVKEYLDKYRISISDEKILLTNDGEFIRWETIANMDWQSLVPNQF